MQNLEANFYPIAMVLLTVFAVSLILTVKSARAWRRTEELRAAKSALLAHYEAMSIIVDDPATPEPLIRFLYNFSEMLQRRDDCENIVDMLMAPEEVRAPRSAATEGLEVLTRTRPDLADHCYTALASGLSAMFLKWPGQGNKFMQFAASIENDRKKTAAFAYRITDADRNRSSDFIGPTHVTA